MRKGRQPSTLKNKIGKRGGDTPAKRRRGGQEPGKPSPETAFEKAVDALTRAGAMGNDRKSSSGSLAILRHQAADSCLQGEVHGLFV
jgi:hypothetical protein